MTDEGHLTKDTPLKKGFGPPFLYANAIEQTRSSGGWVLSFLCRAHSLVRCPPHIRSAPPAHGPIWGNQPVKAWGMSTNCQRGSWKLFAKCQPSAPRMPIERTFKIFAFRERERPATFRAASLAHSGRPRFGSVRLRFGDGTVQAVPVFGSGGSSAKGFFGVSVQFNRKGRFRFRFRFHFRFLRKRFRRFWFPVPVRFLSPLHTVFRCVLTHAFL